MRVMGGRAQHDPHALEAGGVLVGRHIRGSRDVVVDLVTEPMPGDRQSRYSFHRSQKPHQRFLDEIWRTSRKTCVYLGEWHTHPERHPSPSSVDLADWRKRLVKDQVDSESMFFVIVGQVETAAWEGFRGTGRLARLEAVQHAPT
ncbi:Mov34/MPN/PAD-1 family protein [Chondromyces crocatus]|uniref:Mov34/MPN/PAD-1 family protein n=1 Tax=Chondromyces crocatus TaxID=52 RepID=UPI00248085EB|nr:Mov34/MPN/PAD-1 family protein [Chondromyces crocatus]